MSRHTEHTANSMGLVIPQEHLVEDNIFFLLAIGKFSEKSLLIKKNMGGFDDM